MRWAAILVVSGRAMRDGGGVGWLAEHDLGPADRVGKCGKKSIDQHGILQGTK